MLAKEINDHFHHESVLVFALGPVKHMRDIADDAMNEIVCVSQYSGVRVLEISLWVLWRWNI